MTKNTHHINATALISDTNSHINGYIKFNCHVSIPVGYSVVHYRRWLDLIVEHELYLDDDERLPLLASLPSDDRLYLKGQLGVFAKVLQLGRVPVFDPIRVVSCQLQEVQNNRYLMEIEMPAVQFLRLEAYRHALNAGIDLCRWIASNAPTAANRDQVWTVVTNEIVAPLHKIVPGGKSTIPLLRVAHQLGIPFLHLGLGTYQIGWGSRSRRLARSIAETDSYIGTQLAQNKVATANVLRVAGLPAAVHLLVDSMPNAIAAAEQIGFPVVVKPPDSDRGEGVSVDVMDQAALKTAFEFAKQRTKSKQVIIERQVQGVCHRLFFACGQLLYAVKRLPMGVYGDGQRSVAQLVQAQCQLESEKPPWSRSEIQPLDDLAVSALRRSNLAPSSVPDVGKFVPLRRIESTQWGGVDEDVTTRIHPDNVNVGLQAARLFGLEVAGVDMISADITEPWHVNGAMINEVNYAPLFGGGEISRSYIESFYGRFINGNGRIPIEVFETERAALEFQREQHQHGKRCVVTSAQKTIDSDGLDIVMPVTELTQRVKALVLRSDVDAIAVFDGP